MLLPRLFTILIGLPIFALGIYFGGLPFFFLVLGVSFLALREFFVLAEETGYPTFSWTGVTFGVLLVLSVFLNGTKFGQVMENQFTAALISLFVVVLCVRSVLRGPTETLLSEWAVTLFGVMYVAWPLAHIVLIRDLRPQGLAAAFLFFSMIWAADIVAYIVGSRWGRHLIAESISPKKTWEGTIAGVLSAIVVGVLFQLTLLKADLKMVEVIFLALAIGILAFISDLSESLVKRVAGLKDSSTILPGHGGLLDRFDSFLLSAPFFYYYWAFIKH